MFLDPRQPSRWIWTIYHSLWRGCIGWRWVVDARGKWQVPIRSYLCNPLVGMQLSFETLLICLDLEKVLCSVTCRTTPVTSRAATPSASVETTLPQLERSPLRNPFPAISPTLLCLLHISHRKWYLRSMAYVPSPSALMSVYCHVSWCFD